MAEDTNKQTSSLPTQLNLKDIADGVVKINEANSLIITSVSQSVQKFSSLSIKNMDTAIKNLSAIDGQMKSFMTGMAKLITAFSNMKYDKKTIDSIMMYQDAEYEMEQYINADGSTSERYKLDPKTREKIIKEAAGFKIGQVSLMLAQTISSITKPLDVINKQKTSWLSIIKFRKNMKILSTQLGDLLRYSVDMFSGVSINSKDFTEMILGTKDSKITKTLTDQKNSTIENVIEEKPGSYGVVEALLKITELPAALNNMKLVNPITAKIKVAILIHQLTDIVKSVSEMLTKEDKTIKESATSMKKIYDFFDSLVDVFDYIDKLTSKNWIKQKQTRKRLENVFTLLMGGTKKKGTHIEGVIDWMNDLNVALGKANTAQLAKKLEGSFSDVLSSLEESSNSLEKLAILGAPGLGLLVDRAFKVFLGNGKKQKGVIQWLVTMDTTLQEVEFDELSSKVDEMSKILSQIRNCEISITLIGLLAVPAMLGVLMIGLVVKGFEWVAKKLSSKKLADDIKGADKNIENLTKGVLLLSASVLLLALAGVLIAKSMRSFGIVLLFLAGVVLTTALLAMISKPVKEGVETIVKLTFGALMLTLAVVVLAIASQIVSDNWTKFGIVLLFLAGVIAVTFLLALANKLVGEGVKTIVKLALGVLILSLAVIVLAIASQIVSDSWDNFWKIALLVGVMLVLTIVLAAAASFVTTGVAVLTSLAIGALILSVGVLILAIASQIVSDNWSSIAMIGVLILGMVALAAVIGIPVVAAFVGLGSVVIFAMAGAMIMMAVALKKVTDLDLDEKEAKAKVNAVMGVFKQAAEDVSAMKFEGKAVKKMRQLAKIAKQIGKMAKIVTNIANLRMIDEIDKDGNPTKTHNMTAADFESASRNALGVSKFFVSLFDENASNIQIAFGSTIKTLKVTPIKKKDLENINKETKDKMKMIGKIVKSVGTMASVVADVANLRMPTEFDEKGNPTKYQTMGPTEFKQASESVVVIMTTLLTAIMNAAEETKKYKKKHLRKIKEAMELANPLGGMIQSVMDVANGVIPYYTDNKHQKVEVDPETGEPKILGYLTMTDLMTKKKPEIEKTITNLTGMMVDVISNLMSEKGIKSKLRKVSEFSEDYVEPLSAIADMYNGMTLEKANMDGFDRMVNTTSKLLTSISSVDTFKLREAAKMLDSIARMSESINGNFDKLADAINEKLLTALRKLEETLAKLQKDGIDVKGGGNTTATKAVVTAIPANNSKTNENTSNINGADITAIREMMAQIKSYMSTLSGTVKSNRIRVNAKAD